MSMFKPATKYSTRSICDHNCIFEIKVVSRTAKTIKALFHGELKTYRVSIYDGVERIKPCGSYSMCPIITAS